MKPAARKHFSYHSEQVHSAFVNGRGQTRRNIVSIANGKGKKIVETYDAAGKKVDRKEKALNAGELKKIGANQFIPGLFKDCVECGASGKKTRKVKVKAFRK